MTLRLLLRQDNLRQRSAGTVFSQRIVRVDDYCVAVQWIDRHLEQIQKIAGTRRAGHPVRANYTDVVRGVAYETLSEARAVADRLRNIDIPNGAGVVFAVRSGRVIDDIDRAAVT